MTFSGLISPSVQAQLGPGYQVRPLSLSDYDKGYLQLLGMLTTVGNVSRESFKNQFEYLQANDAYYCIVIEDVAKRLIVGSGTLMVERKFIHSCGRVGHIEDIVVDASYRGHALGLRVIETLKHIGARVGCYKLILDCSQANAPFYVKCGFTQKEIEMALYLPLNESIPKL